MLLLLLLLPLLVQRMLPWLPTFPSFLARPRMRQTAAQPMPALHPPHQPFASMFWARSSPGLLYHPAREQLMQRALPPHSHLRCWVRHSPPQQAQQLLHPHFHPCISAPPQCQGA